MSNKRLISLVALILCACLSASAQMTDEAVISYITKGLAAGKTQSQIGRELMGMGMSSAQAKKLMQTYKSDSTFDLVAQPKRDDTDSKDHIRTVSSDGDINKVRSDSSKSDSEKGSAAKKGVEDKTIDNERKIYGHDLFNNDKLTFEPNVNSAVPESYVLGPGDEVIIDVWGVNETTIKKTISAEGRILISQVGPIQLAGLSIKDATATIKKSLSRKYSLSGDSSASQISVTLGTIRTIQVNVIGEVNVPGTYRLSAFSTVFSALYQAGGVTEIGSLRNIRISRGGKVIQTADVYRLLFGGGSEGDIHLQDGDAIIVPAYSALVKADGGVKRPMLYEIVPGEPLANLMEYCGGFTSNAYTEEVAIQRIDGKNGHVYSVGESDFATFGMQDGDTLFVYSNMRKELYQNRIQVKGAVARPGVYELGSGIATVRQLLEHAGGLLEDAYTTRAQIVREKPDRTLSIMAVPVGAIMKGAASDVLLQKNDVLIVSDNSKIDAKGDITISGFVRHPGEYQYAEGMTLEDLILIAGGLENGASAVNVEVARRVVDDSATEATDTLARIFNMSIKDDIELAEAPVFCLEPYDVVSIRKSPTYVEQRRVFISGEMMFPGEYTLATTEERLSDLFNRAGGANSNAYLGGASLRRKITDAERNVQSHMLDIVRAGYLKADSLALKRMLDEDTYMVGINLKKALAHPGSDADIILLDGDELIVPQMATTVSVQGSVMYPNSVSFRPGKPLKYYVDQAGGFSKEASRSKVYVLYMNGEVATGHRSEVKAGSEIMVPSRPERQKASMAEWASVGASTASIAAVVASLIINMVK